MKVKGLRSSDNESDHNYRWVNEYFSDAYRVVTSTYRMDTGELNSYFTLQKKKGPLWVGIKYFVTWERACRTAKDIAKNGG